MKLRSLPILFWWVPCFAHSPQILGSNITITYDVSEGRFGDQLLCYLHGKWMSYKYGVPLLYKPFRHSEAFMLHEKEECWTQEKQDVFEQIVVHVKDGEPTSSLGSLLYVIPFFSENPDDMQYHQDEWAHFPVDWKDKNFCLILREMFSPRNQPAPISFPKEREYLTVALHVRRGGGYDPLAAFMLWPLRFAPDTYFIESLRKLCEMYPDRPIYAYIFTDDQNPVVIMNKYQRALRDLPITFDCRKEGNHYNAHVIEDFFSMMNFDCLIRSHSNYSLIPSIIADYQVVMTPKHFTWRQELNPTSPFVGTYIDEIDIDIRKVPL